MALGMFDNVGGFRGIRQLSGPELMQLAIQSLSETLRGPQGVPTNAARQHAINIANQLRDIDSSWDATPFLRSYIPSAASLDPSTRQALQNFALSEVARGVSPEVASQWLQGMRGGAATAQQALRDLDFETRWNLLTEGRVYDPFTGQFVQAEPYRQAMGAVATEWMADAGVSPQAMQAWALANDPAFLRAATDSIARASGLDVPERVGVAQDLINLFQREGFTEDMIREALLKHVGRLTADELNRIEKWIRSTELPSTYRGDSAKASRLLDLYFQELAKRVNEGAQIVGPGQTWPFWR